MIFTTEVMEPGGGLGVLFPALPGSQKIEARAKAQFSHGESLSSAPAFRQEITRQENTAALFQSPVGRKINIAVFPRPGKAGGVEFQGGGFHFLWLAKPGFFVISLTPLRSEVLKGPKRRS